MTHGYLRKNGSGLTFFRLFCAVFFICLRKFYKSVEVLHERRFAAARMTYYAEKFPLGYMQINALKRLGRERRFCRIRERKVFDVYVPLTAVLRNRCGNILRRTLCRAAVLNFGGNLFGERFGGKAVGYRYAVFLQSFADFAYARQT